MTSAGVTSEAAGIPARKDNTFAVGSRSHCVKATVPCTAGRGKKAKAGMEPKACSLSPLGNAAVTLVRRRGGSTTPHGVHASPLRPQTTNLHLSRLYSYTVSGIIDQHNFKWLKTNGERFWGFFLLLLFFYLFFCFPVEIRVIRSDFSEVKLVIRFLFLLLCGCWQSAEVPSHTHSTARTLQTLTSPVTPEKTLLIAKQTLCVRACVRACVCVCVCACVKGG